MKQTIQSKLSNTYAEHATGTKITVVACVVLIGNSRHAAAVLPLSVRMRRSRRLANEEAASPNSNTFSAARWMCLTLTSAVFRHNAFRRILSISFFNSLNACVLLLLLELPPSRGNRKSFATSAALLFKDQSFRDSGSERTPLSQSISQLLASQLFFTFPSVS